MIGRKFDDEKVQNEMKHWTFKVINHGGRPKIQVNLKGESVSYLPEEISSMVLTKMKETAENYLGKKVKDVVITVPAYFSDGQRQATKDAGEIAGLNVLRTMNEPIAAAIAYGLDKKVDAKRNVLIFDLGGGTFDVSILTVKGGEFEVKTYEGDSHLGGEDFNNRLVDHFVQEFNRKHGNITTDKSSLSRLRKAIEKAKRTLTSTAQARISIDKLFGGIDFVTSITRARFEELNADLFSKTIEHVESALKLVKMSKAEINDVVLVGGSTRIPKIQHLLQEFFDGKELYKTINPDEAVAYGKLFESNLNSYFVISSFYYLTLGAAIQAAILQGDDSEELKKFKFIDVTPLNLGVNVHGGYTSVVIPRNSPIPANCTENYTTVYDEQTMVTVEVSEGDNVMCEDNNLLGKFRLFDIPAEPAGVPKIQITFRIDANGILHVKAIEQASQKTAKTRIDYGNKRLTQEDKDRMISNIEDFREQDKKKRDCIRAKNDLEKFCFRVQDKINAAGIFSGISKINKNLILKKCSETFDWLDANNNSHHGYDALKYENRKKELEEMIESSRGFFLVALLQNLLIS